ncbi:MAG: hypothetical protein IKY23_12260 [Lachnospiraceae bacterium]|nr:hypothetical protein [Lachnospiraceae bacterium]
MKRKLLAIVLVAMLSLGMLACGTENPAAAESAEIEETPVAVEEKVDESVSEVDEAVEVEQENVIEATETDVSEEVETQSKPTWYMDEEGIKSEELGLVVKKDNGVFQTVELWGNIGVHTGTNSGYQGIVFCNYYDGDLDTYISDNSNMQKGNYKQIEYAYGDGIYRSSAKRIVFIGNGIKIATELEEIKEGESINDYLDRVQLIREYDKDETDYLAYINNCGLYVPSLGFKISCDESEHVINGIGVQLSWSEDNTMIKLSDESVEGWGKMYYVYDTHNAQEVVDTFVEGINNSMGTVEIIEDTSEINFGNNTFLGRGAICRNEGEDANGDEEWLFYSDNSTWSINIDYKEGNHYDDYFGVFETLN